MEKIFTTVFWREMIERLDDRVEINWKIIILVYYF